MSRRGGVILYLALAAGLLVAARPVEVHLVRMRSEVRLFSGGKVTEYTLSDFSARGEGAASSALFIRCLGGLRGIIADMLWMRTLRMEEQGRRYEQVALLQGIIQMQPHFTSVWAYQAHVLVYDLGSVSLSPDVAESYRWIRRGIDVLEEGIEQNPSGHLLHYELAGVYQHKLSPFSINKDVWPQLVAEWQTELRNRAEREGRPPPEGLDAYMGLRKAREHYLLAAEKPDISASRKLLCERFAIRCLERMGDFRGAEAGWRELHKRYKPGTWGHRVVERFFRGFMRTLTAEFLVAGKLAESRDAYGRMREYFGEALPVYRELIAEEIRVRHTTARDEKRARELYQALRAAERDETRSFEEIVKPPARHEPGDGHQH